jgi:transposase
MSNCVSSIPYRRIESLLPFFDGEGCDGGLRDFSGCDSLGFAKTPRSRIMAWTETTRPKYRRDGRPSTRGRVRYAGDTTDEEWALIEPHLPPPANRGRTRETSLRDVVNAIHYIAEPGCQWRLLPKDFPPYLTVQRYFYSWRDNGLWQTINHVLLMAVREDAGREAGPAAGVIDSQSVKTIESGGPRGYGAGKKTKAVSAIFSLTPSACRSE